MTQDLSGVVAEHIQAVNAFDTQAILATFANDAYVNDVQREIVGAAAIRRWVEQEIVGAHVTIEVREVLEHHGQSIVRGRYDGEYDKTNLPKELILTNYFTVQNGKIVSLIIVFNKPSEY
jgi:SnoaL-like domain